MVPGEHEAPRSSRIHRLMNFPCQAWWALLRLAAPGCQGHHPSNKRQCRAVAMRADTSRCNLATPQVGHLTDKEPPGATGTEILGYARCPKHVTRGHRTLCVTVSGAGTHSGPAVAGSNKRPTTHDCVRYDHGTDIETPASSAHGYQPPCLLPACLCCPSQPSQCRIVSYAVQDIPLLAHELTYGDKVASSRPTDGQT